MKFVVTMDSNIADMFLASGYILIAQSDDTYTFLNNDKLCINFSNIDKTKFFYTNILCV